IGSDKKYYFVCNNKEYSLSEGKIKIELTNNKAIILNKSYSLPVKFIPSGYFLVNNKIYRINIIINCSKTGTNIINELKIEDYLKGILPKEASSSWNSEALKAQAVISRTYALKNIGKHSKDGFDICSQVHCQVYGGASCETKNCNKAVLDTKGEVVFYDNDLAQTFFHSSCGGHTENPKYVWQWKTDTPKYLKGVKDNYCKKNPHQTWKTTIPETTIREKLIKAGYKIGKIKKISTSGTTTAKAAKEIIVKHSKGTLKLNSYTFRCTISPDKIKSTSIKSIKFKNKNFTFEGKGWGHKVGLCQWGAKAMGDKNISYKKILKFYYPGTTIRKIDYAK
nr:SpoIID/LytB domain-containing protein [Endomicrobiaceae bacterium]